MQLSFSTFNTSLVVISIKGRLTLVRALRMLVNVEADQCDDIENEIHPANH